MKLLRASVAALLCGVSCAFVSDTRHARGYPALRRTPTARSYHQEKLVGRQSLAALSMSAVADGQECPGGSCPIPKFRGKLHRNVSISASRPTLAVSPLGWVRRLRHMRVQPCSPHRRTAPPPRRPTSTF